MSLLKSLPLLGPVFLINIYTVLFCPRYLSCMIDSPAHCLDYLFCHEDFDVSEVFYKPRLKYGSRLLLYRYANNTQELFINKWDVQKGLRRNEDNLAVKCATKVCHSFIETGLSHSSKAVIGNGSKGIQHQHFPMHNQQSSLVNQGLTMLYFNATFITATKTTI